MKNLIHYFPYIIIYLKKSKHIRKVIASPVIKLETNRCNNSCDINITEFRLEVGCRSVLVIPIKQSLSFS